MIYLCIFIFRGKARVRLHYLLWHKNGRTHSQAVTLATPEPAVSELESHPAPHPTVDQEPESQPAPDPVPENEALAKQNHIIKRKPRALVRVANSYYLVLERTREEARDLFNPLGAPCFCLHWTAM
jgi:hypothetical protein